MAARNPAQIRNVTFAGHAGCGKTLLVERLLLAAGAIQRLGSIEDGTTVSDWTDQEKSHQHSLSASCVHFEKGDLLVNVVDTPGLADFIGQSIGAMPAAETVIVVVDAVKGIETVTRRVMTVAGERNLPRAIVINKIDMHEADLPALVAKLRETFGSACLPINLPSEDGSAVVNVLEQDGGATAFSSAEEAHTQVLEQVVEVDEALMEAYLETGGEGLGQGQGARRVRAGAPRGTPRAHLLSPPPSRASAQKRCSTSSPATAPAHSKGNPRPFRRPRRRVLDRRPRQTPSPPSPTSSRSRRTRSSASSASFRVHQGNDQVQE